MATIERVAIHQGWPLRGVPIERGSTVYDGEVTLYCVIIHPPHYTLTGYPREHNDQESRHWRGDAA